LVIQKYWNVPPIWRAFEPSTLANTSRYRDRGLRVKGLLARGMYLSLYKMHEVALHGVSKVALDTLARRITRRTEPHVKLH
jgi:hypothetical protein